ncbi:MAG: M28 family peptidase [Gemmatimonadota bacterium]
MRTRAAVIGFLLVGQGLAAQAAEPLRGFAPAAAALQRRWETRFRSQIEPGNLRDYLRVLSAEPHHAGSPGSKRMAEYILGRFQEWGLDARIEEFTVLLPQPTERVLELLEPERYEATLVEPPIPEDSTSGSSGQVPTYNAYSANGDVTAELVYVNYGVPEDYERLSRLGVDVRGKIVIARYGHTAFRGLKPKTAAEHGAVGCVIYSDPREDGYYNEPIYPEGPARPWRGVQRGSTYYMPIQNGDPLTPGWASDSGAKRLTLAEAANMMPPIPVLPISYQDALPFLRALTGPVAPEDWRGALPITYRIGPGPARVHLKVTLDWKVRPIYDVIARIPGAVSPDQWIIRGNHHDAWVHGANDPGSGNVGLLETARALGQLVKEGWKPNRTIILASWDAEEWGLIGSTEWGEKHAAELAEKAVAYINTDTSGRGWFTPGGSHSLQALVSEAAGAVLQPGLRTTVLQAARDHLATLAATTSARAAAHVAPLPLYGLGAETDYAVFLGHLGIASLDLLFDGDWSWRGTYHSTYDSFYWYTHFGDPTFAYGKALAETSGTILLRLADATVLPFEFGNMATAIRGYVEEIERLPEIRKSGRSFSFGPIRSALGRLDLAAKSSSVAFARLGVAQGNIADSHRRELESVDRLLYTAERLLLHEPGLPDRPWFRHLIYASDPYHGNEVSTLPPIREGIERDQWEQAHAFVPIVARAIDRLAARVTEAAVGLTKSVARMTPP